MTVRINSDSAHVAKIREALKKNGGYCPCAIEHNEDTKCICKEFMEQKKLGYCTCKLYYKEEI